jgi:hypothetical protein
VAITTAVYTRYDRRWVWYEETAEDSGLGMILVVGDWVMASGVGGEREIFRPQYPPQSRARATEELGNIM